MTHYWQLIAVFVENKGVPRRDAFGRTLFDLLYFPFPILFMNCGE
jgi:hypothetical protein